jgi:hypothetical protein
VVLGPVLAFVVPVAVGIMATVATGVAAVAKGVAVIQGVLVVRG